MTTGRAVRLVVLAATLACCASGTMILWNPRTGECDEVPKAAAYAMGGGLFAATKDMDRLGGARG
jgi:hypothetical protein